MYICIHVYMDGRRKYWGLGGAYD